MIIREDTGAYYCNLETVNYKQPGKKVTLRVIDGIAPEVLQVFKHRFKYAEVIFKFKVLKRNQ